MFQHDLLVNSQQLDSEIDTEISQWESIWLHTSQWGYAIVIAFAICNLVVSFIKAEGKLMWVNIFMIIGLTLLALPFWFTLETERSQVVFLQVGNFCLSFSIILLTHALKQPEKDGKKPLTCTVLMTLASAGMALNWCILTLIVGDEVLKITEFAKGASWASLYGLISQIMLNVYGKLDLEIQANHKVVKFGKIAMRMITFDSGYFFLVLFVEMFLDNDPFFWLWLGDLAILTGLLTFEVSIFYAVYNVGAGLRQEILDEHKEKYLPDNEASGEGETDSNSEEEPSENTQAAQEFVGSLF